MRRRAWRRIRDRGRSAPVGFGPIHVGGRRRERATQGENTKSGTVANSAKVVSLAVRTHEHPLKEAGHSFGVACLLLLAGFGPPALAVTAIVRAADWKYLLGVPILVALSFTLGRRKPPPAPDAPPPRARLWQTVLNQLPFFYALGVLLVHHAWVWAGCVAAAFVLGGLAARAIAMRELARMNRGDVSEASGARRVEAP